MASVGAGSFDRGTVVNHLQSFENKSASLVSNIDVFLDVLGDIAEALVKGSSEDKVATCKAAYRDALAVRADAEAHIKALGSLRRTYAPTNGATDFARLLREDSNVAAVQSSCPGDDAQFIEFEHRLATLNGPVEPQPMDENVDIMVDETQGTSAANAICPISGRQVLNIADPVEDERGYVYSRPEIEAYILRHTRGSETEVTAPIAGVTHKISLATLKRATRILWEQKRTRQQTQQRAGESENVLEF